MQLDAKVLRQLAHALGAVDEHGTRGGRLIEDAQRLWNRVGKFIALHLTGEVDLEALEMACYAMQLPMRQAKLPSAGKLGRTNLRERAEQAAELLVSTMGEQVDEALLDRATRVLQETPHRSPMLEEAKLLADSVNLDDFGVIGLVGQMIQLARQGEGVGQLAEGSEKRDQYGYWEARLKDGFHFEPVRHIARQRLAHARQVASLLVEELKEDQP